MSDLYLNMEDDPLEQEFKNIFKRFSIDPFLVSLLPLDLDFKWFISW